MSAIVLGSAYSDEPRRGVPQGGDSHHHHDSYAPPVSPDQLGGSFEFLDLKNRPVSAADFMGHWTLLFFGYARCKGSCPVATPKIVKAARMLREQHVKAQAVFVDIETPPLGLVRRASGASAMANGHSHGDMNRVAAMRGLASSHAGQLTVLTGTRAQLSNAARAFMVAREHTPPRRGEEGHSIKHSSRIYFIAPDTKVAGYAYPDADPAELAATVTKLSRKKRGD